MTRKHFWKAALLLNLVAAPHAIAHDDHHHHIAHQPAVCEAHEHRHAGRDCHSHDKPVHPLYARSHADQPHAPQARADEGEVHHGHNHEAEARHLMHHPKFGLKFSFGF